MCFAFVMLALVFRRARWVPVVLGLSGAVGLAVACGGDDPAVGPDADGGLEGGQIVTLPDGAVIVVPPGGDAGVDSDTPFEPGPDGGGTGCGGTDVDPGGAAMVEGYMDALPNPPPAGATRTAAVDAILRTCEVFGPDPAKNAGWKKEYCYAHLVASVSKESAYNPTVKVNDAYATRAIGSQRANDPVVGLLQIRFSSTVHEVVALGNLERLACVGCPIPASVSARAAEPGSSPYWAVTGPTQNMSLMTNVACNVAMGAWFYYVASMGNGKASAVTYPDAYCAGSGTAGNVITGLLSHLKGFEGGRGFIANQAGLNALQGSDPGGYQYVTQIKTMFDGMVGPIAGAHPFFARLSPDTAAHCK